MHFDKDTNYKGINDKLLLYDNYHTKFQKLSLSYMQDSIKHQMVEEISLQMTISKNLEPLHPVHPTVVINVAFKELIRLYIDMDIIDMMLHHLFSLLT